MFDAIEKIFAPASDFSETLNRDATRDHARGMSFANRMHGMRSFGLALGFVCVGSVLWIHDEPTLVWMLLATNAFLWPHVAHRLAIRNPDPARAELHNLAIDSALGGIWVAVMQFNLLPSVLLVTMLSVDKIAVGGLRFGARTFGILAAACALTWAAIGFPIGIESQPVVVIACIPLLVGYTLALSNVMYGLATKVARQNKLLMQLSNTDELTGLANRRQGFDAAAKALARHRRNSTATVLVVLDFDRFKDVNDTYGHPFGDDVLKAVAATLRKCSRETDTIARYGGDEFILVLADTDLQGAHVVAKRIREQLAVIKFAEAPGLRCTVSLGLAEAYADTKEVEDWIHQADGALYRAKAAGRDCVVSAPKVHRSAATSATHP